LKQSTRQRFVASIRLPARRREAVIVCARSGINEARRAIWFDGQKVRNLRRHGLEEGFRRAVDLRRATESPSDPADPGRRVAMCSPITDDRDLQRSIREIVTTVI